MYKHLITLWVLALTLSLHPATQAALPSMLDGQPLPTLAPMLDRVTPAVVNISTTQWRRAQENPLLNDPFFRYFFNLPNEPEKKDNQSLGSGVVIDARRGYVITNHHVIDKADEITVTLRDGRSLNAELVGTDPETDVALLKVAADNLTAVSSANSDQLRVGDFVVAIGNPFGLGQTVTSGIVSALGRSGLGIEGYEDFIQTDASINPGNSGGALVNLRGELVGINTAILAPSGGNVGIGFAIPVNMVNRIVQHLSKYGEVKRGVLGVHLQDMTPDLADAFGIQNVKGALVVEVANGSPADKAGMRKGDVITLIDRKSVEDSSDARNHIGLLRVGDRVRVTILRKGRILHLYAIIEDPNKVASISGIDGGRLNRYLEGAILTDRRGMIEVKGVERDSIAWQIGLRKGDIVLALNRRPLTEVDDLAQGLSRKNSPYAIKIRRDDDIISFVFR
ncbi:DegQ family serine endoprotease [Candidatus Albibeggiatoa sp. nov. NOAA]|uniref:DegQ family serine endoprotease n=1 Tax=Candidatus Albibeggiatoa sp. nov. NOAA TaxID=3162724 RepID=UPI0032FED893|nr:DegQ family serine endoprotease [Thiotrichaceae bacterium]